MLKHKFLIKRAKSVLKELAALVACLTGSAAWGQDTWAFEPGRDAFDPEAVLDLRYLNEEEAGQSGWLSANASGDFELGNGEPVRFWATNTGVERHVPFQPRPKTGWQTEQDIEHHARWLAKRGVNLVRLHSHINPDPESQKIDEVSQDEVDWIWRTVAAMKREGIYTVVSPFWANTMESDDAKWGTDWEGSHHGLLFFDETLQAAYKEWLRVLFTTPNDFLGGGTLAEEPALGIFQIQNEDSLLFWTVDNLSDSSKRRLGNLFFKWAEGKYGSIEKALTAWGAGFSEGDDVINEVLGMSHLWNLTGEGKAEVGEHPRLDDQLQFYVETMMDFNTEIRRYIQEDLGCPVLVNAGNWKTADVVYLEDSERYSYAASSDVVALNRYFSGVHEGEYKGWGIVGGDVFTNPSVLKDSPLSLPVSVKQPAGKPTLVTESTWVMPMDTAFEAPMLISAYSSLSGFDGYFGFAAETEGFVPPRSANGYNDSQEMWVCLTPDMAGQWPAAALAFRKGYIRQAEPVVQEHRSLESLWQRKSPVIAESASFDPNRDSGDLPPDSSLEGGVDPYAFLVGPVSVTYDSNESNSKVAENLDTFIEKSDDGTRVTSVTGELTLDTAAQQFTVDTPYVQSLVSYQAVDVALSDVTYESPTGGLAVTAISLDGRPLSVSAKVLVQMATRSRPTGWSDQATEIELSDGTIVQGRKVIDYGGAPWVLDTRALTVRLSNNRISEAFALDANGMIVAEAPLAVEGERAVFEFPEGALYVVLIGDPEAEYEDWAERQSWLQPEEDAKFDADPDKDGVANLMEFASASDPLSFSSRGGIEQIAIGSQETKRLEISYRKSKFAGGVVDDFYFSEDLVNWLPLAAAAVDSLDGLLTDDADGDGLAETRRLSLSLNEDSRGIYLRRRIGKIDGE